MVFNNRNRNQVDPKIEAAKELEETLASIKITALNLSHANLNHISNKEIDSVVALTKKAQRNTITVEEFKSLRNLQVKLDYAVQESVKTNNNQKHKLSDLVENFSHIINDPMLSDNTRNHYTGQLKSILKSAGENVTDINNFENLNPQKIRNLSEALKGKSISQKKVLKAAPLSLWSKDEAHARRSTTARTTSYVKGRFGTATKTAVSNTSMGLLTSTLGGLGLGAIDSHLDISGRAHGAASNFINNRLSKYGNRKSSLSKIAPLITSNTLSNSFKNIPDEVTDTKSPKAPKSGSGTGRGSGGKVQTEKLDQIINVTQQGNKEIVGQLGAVNNSIAQLVRIMTPRRGAQDLSKYTRHIEDDMAKSGMSGEGGAAGFGALGGLGTGGGPGGSPGGHGGGEGGGGSSHMLEEVAGFLGLKKFGGFLANKFPKIGRFARPLVKAATAGYSLLSGDVAPLMAQMLGGGEAAGAAAGVAGTAAKTTGLLGKLGKFAGGAARAAGKFAPWAQAGLIGYDAYSGYKNSTGSTNDRIHAGLNNAASQATFGLISPETFAAGNKFINEHLYGGSPSTSETLTQTPFRSMPKPNVATSTNSNIIPSGEEDHGDDSDEILFSSKLSRSERMANLRKKKNATPEDSIKARWGMDEYRRMRAMKAQSPATPSTVNSISPFNNANSSISGIDVTGTTPGSRTASDTASTNTMGGTTQTPGVGRGNRVGTGAGSTSTGGQGSTPTNSTTLSQEKIGQMQYAQANASLHGDDAAAKAIGDKLPGGSNSQTAAAPSSQGDGGSGSGKGSRSWRNNNPGNIEAGKYASAHGAIGTDGRFAIFPNYEAGRKAQSNLLFDSKGYKDLTVAQAISKWAPSSENNVPAYIKAMGADPNAKMSSFSPEQRNQLLDAMQKHEGFTPGRTKSPGATDNPIAQNSASNTSNSSVTGSGGPAAAVDKLMSLKDIGDGRYAKGENDPGKLNSFIKDGGIKFEGKDFDVTKTAWCAAILGSALNQSGVKSTGSPQATSYLGFGAAVDLNKDRIHKGDIVVRDNGDGVHGHVMIATGNVDKNGKIEVIAGNQGKRVSIDSVNPNNLSIRRATEKEMGATQQIVDTVQNHGETAVNKSIASGSTDSSINSPVNKELVNRTPTSPKSDATTNGKSAMGATNLPLERIGEAVLASNVTKMGATKLPLERIGETALASNARMAQNLGMSAPNAPGPLGGLNSINIPAPDLPGKISGLNNLNSNLGIAAPNLPGDLSGLNNLQTNLGVPAPDLPGNLSGMPSRSMGTMQNYGAQQARNSGSTAGSSSGLSMGSFGGNSLLDFKASKWTRQDLGNIGSTFEDGRAGGLNIMPGASPVLNSGTMTSPTGATTSNWNPAVASGEDSVINARKAVSTSPVSDNAPSTPIPANPNPPVDVVESGTPGSARESPTPPSPGTSSGGSGRSAGNNHRKPSKHVDDVYLAAYNNMLFHNAG